MIKELTKMLAISGYATAFIIMAYALLLAVFNGGTVTLDFNHYNEMIWEVMLMVIVTYCIMFDALTRTNEVMR